MLSVGSLPQTSMTSQNVVTTTATLSRHGRQQTGSTFHLSQKIRAINRGALATENLKLPKPKRMRYYANRDRNSRMCENSRTSRSTGCFRVELEAHLVQLPRWVCCEQTSNSSFRPCHQREGSDQLKHRRNRERWKDICKRLMNIYTCTHHDRLQSSRRILELEKSRTFGLK